MPVKILKFRNKNAKCRLEKWKNGNSNNSGVGDDVVKFIERDFVVELLSEKIKSSNYSIMEPLSKKIKLDDYSDCSNVTKNENSACVKLIINQFQKEGIKFDNELENDENEPNKVRKEKNENEKSDHHHLFTTPSESNSTTISNTMFADSNKYLHKKFKKMAAILSDDCNSGLPHMVDGASAASVAATTISIFDNHTTSSGISLNANVCNISTSNGSSSSSSSSSVIGNTSTIMTVAAATTITTASASAYKSSLPECTRGSSSSNDVITSAASSAAVSIGTRIEENRGSVPPSNNQFTNNNNSNSKNNHNSSNHNNISNEEHNLTARSKSTTAFTNLYNNSQSAVPSSAGATAAATAAAATTTTVQYNAFSAGAPVIVTEEDGSVPAIIGRYACPYCKLVCNKPSVLQKHIRAHTNERPYPCLPCGFAFKTRSNLYKHCRSRSHSLKLEEVGMDNANTKMYAAEEETTTDHEEEEMSSGVAQVLAATTTTTATVGTPLLLGKEETTTTTVGGVIAAEETVQKKSSIYKPKFHKASIYIQNNNGNACLTTSSSSSRSNHHVNESAPVLAKFPVTNTLNKLGLQLKLSPPLSAVAIPPSPAPRSGGSSTSSASSPFTSGSSPSPEFLQRHINKLINENQAIVETTDPFWSKKFYQQRKEGCGGGGGGGGCVISPSSSPLSTVCPAPVEQQPPPYKKPPAPQQPPITVKQESALVEDKLLPAESKLAHALLQPRAAKANTMMLLPVENAMVAEDVQPLNLTMRKDTSARSKSYLDASSTSSSSTAGERSSECGGNYKTAEIVGASVVAPAPNGIKFTPNGVFSYVKPEMSQTRLEAAAAGGTCAQVALPLPQNVKVKEESGVLGSGQAAGQVIYPKPEEKDLLASSTGAKFVRPTSLPLKPGTFIPKKMQAGTFSVLPLISPETPRPNKSYGQLYIGGNAYTYLGLKCSTRSTFCTLHKSQPTYVPLSPEHNKVSMYSNWKVRSEVDPYLRDVPSTKAMSCYDSRQRYSPYTTVHSKMKDAVTHSSYWFNRAKMQTEAQEPKSNADEENKENNSLLQSSDMNMKAEDISKLSKICMGGIESTDNYTYIRGRGRGKYVCLECGIRCRKPSMLKKHIRTHTDVRPYICKHCVFGFKTKGNLTKHMKSKAHYKKCIELGIVPVPTVVDDSYVDEEVLSKQAQQIEEGQDIEETEEEDEDEEDDDDDDNDEDYGEEKESEDPKCQLEREVAKSLLSLSKMSHQTVSEQYANAGLVPLNARPNTYPYDFSASSHMSSSKAQTPTLTLISEQKEREKVSKNTGLARELQPTPTTTTTLTTNHIVKHHQSPKNETQLDNRYYFGSSLSSTTTTTTTTEKECCSSLTLSTSSAMTTIVTSTSAALNMISSDMVARRHHESSKDMSTMVAAAALPAKTSYVERTQPPAAPPAPPQPPTKAELPTMDRAGEVVVVSSSETAAVAKGGNLVIRDAEPAAAAEKQPECSTSVIIYIGSPNSNLSNPSKRLKPDFITPCNGPLPKYASVLEDGRSKCVVCNKVFSKPSQLRLHVNIHYFEQPFRCESCAVSFRTKGHLHKHLGSNSHLNKVSMNSAAGGQTSTNNPRPFKCDDCSIGFRIHGHLAKHLRSKMHIMKLECVGKLPFGTYAEMERCGINMNDIDTTDCENSLESLQRIAKGVVGSVMYVNNGDAGDNKMVSDSSF